MNQRKPRAIQKTLKILNPLFGQCLDTGFLIIFFKAFCFDSAEVQKTMHNSYYPECICQEHWQLGINLRFNWWCKLYTPKKGAYLDITPGRFFFYILSSVYRIPRSVPTKLTPPPCLPSVKVYTIVKEKKREAAKFRFILSASSTNVLQRWKFFCKSATFVSLNYRILLCDFDKIQHPREKMALSII